MRIAVIGVPTNSSGTIDGVALAPGAYRRAGLIDALSRHAEVEDFGDVDLPAPSPVRSPTSGIIAETAMVSMIAQVQTAVSKALSQQQFPLVLGGDCPILLGCLQAVRHAGRQTGLLFVDGHEDAYLPHESPTGESADMELGLVLGRLTPGLPEELSRILPLLDASQVSLFGARDAQILEDEGVTSIASQVEFHGLKDLQSGGLQARVVAAAGRLEALCGSIWFHLDLDVLSTEALPAVDYRQPGGLNWDELETLTKTAFQSGTIIGFDVAIYNPDMDEDGIHAARIVSYLESVIAGLTARSSSKAAASGS